MVLQILVLTVLYTVVLLALLVLVRQAGVPGRWAILAAFVLFGLLSGFLSAWLWPLDSSTYPNLLGVTLGDWTYTQAVQLFGNPGSSQAHYSVPWPMRVPQLYVLTSTISASLIGITFQWIYNRSHTRD